MNLSGREVAKELNVSHTTVRHYLKKFGIVKNKKHIYSKSNFNDNSNDDKKTCSRCLIAKDLSEFYKDKRKVKGLTSYCKSCNSELVVLRQQQNKKTAIEYKGGCCQNCSFDAYDGALEFHHLDPKSKEFDFSHFNRSIEKVKEELDKCILLCANCHRMTHAGLTKYSIKK